MSYYQKRKAILKDELIHINDVIVPLRHQKSNPKLSYFELDEFFDFKLIKRYGLVKLFNCLLAQ